MCHFFHLFDVPHCNLTTFRSLFEASFPSVHLPSIYGHTGRKSCQKALKLAGFDARNKILELNDVPIDQCSQPGMMPNIDKDSSSMKGRVEVKIQRRNCDRRLRKITLRLNTFQNASGLFHRRIVYNVQCIAPTFQGFLNGKANRRLADSDEIGGARVFAVASDRTASVTTLAGLFGSDPQPFLLSSNSELNDVTIDQRSQPGMMTNKDMDGSSMKGRVEVKMRRRKRQARCSAPTVMPAETRQMSMPRQKPVPSKLVSAPALPSPVAINTTSTLHTLHSAEKNAFCVDSATPDPHFYSVTLSDDALNCH
uniref:Uncharacterized protein n=1 Tax=Panagrellus redivivus TaxID=6233 RepID=A0A7E4W184_PANRE